jgi:hypothetical protein
MSRGRLLVQMLSEIAGKRIKIYHPRASACGAAICAGVAAGLYPDLKSGVAELVEMESQCESHSEDQRIYQGLYQNWKSLNSARAEADKLAADLSVQRILSSPSTEEKTSHEMRFRPHILVTADVDASALDQLRQLGEVGYAGYRQEMPMLTDEDLVHALRGFQIFLTEVDVVDAESIRQLPDLRVIFSCRGNPVNIDIGACSAYGIPVINTPGRNAEGAVPSLIRKVGNERDEMLEILKELYAAGLITSTGGNISCRIAGRENELWITPGQIYKGSLAPERMVRIDLQGKPLDPDAPSASSERLVHCAILRRRPDVEAVIHSHAPKAITLALC